jgi:serine/threonine-protein kinase
MLLFSGISGVFVYSVIQLAPLLPERVATHFGLHGEANGWMTASDHVRFLLGSGLGLAGLLVALCHVLRFLPSRLVNLPDPDYWRLPANYPEACEIVAHWSWHLGSLQLLFLGTLNYVLVAANQLSPPRLSTAAIFLPMGIFLTGLIVLVWVLFRTLKRARAAAASSPT